MDLLGALFGVVRAGTESRGAGLRMRFLVNMRELMLAVLFGLFGAGLLPSQASSAVRLKDIAAIDVGGGLQLVS